MEQLVGASQCLARGKQASGSPAQDGPSGGHHQGGWHALARYIRDDQSQSAIRQRQEIVRITADSLGWLPVHRHLPTGQRWQLLRQKGLLNDLGNGQLLLDALLFRSLGLVLVNEQPYPDRRQDHAQRQE